MIADHSSFFFLFFFVERRGRARPTTYLVTFFCTCTQSLEWSHKKYVCKASALLADRAYRCGKREQKRVLEYLHDNENQLHHRKGNFYGGIAVDVANVAGDFEDIHDDTEEPEEHQASWSSRTCQTWSETFFVIEINAVPYP